MPELTGLELIKYIKQNNIASKIVMLTGCPEMEQFLAEAVGADGYLKKPCELAQIMATIDKLSPTK